ncbi:MAG: efflux RND transporter periplasmic adaptor subunit [Polyangiales bacterium]
MPKRGLKFCGSPSTRKRAGGTVIVCLLLAAYLPGCGRNDADDNVAPPPPVVVQHPEVTTIAPTSESTAEILPSRQSTLRAETAGRVIATNVDLGDSVKIGDVLMRLDVGRSTTALQAAQASVAQADAQTSQARRELERAEALFNAGGLSAQMYDQAKDAVKLAAAAKDAAVAQVNLSRRGLTEATIRAPFSGTVVRRLVEIGEFVAPGAPLITVADASELKATVLLDPLTSLDVQPGADVTVRVFARPNEVFKGTVSRVGEVVDDRSRRLPVEVRVLDPSKRILPGIVGRFSVQVGPEKPALLLPSRAVFKRFGEDHVFVVADGKAMRRAVVVERANAGRVNVLQGVESKDSVVVDGMGRAVHDSPVNVVDPKKPSSAPSKSAPPQKAETTVDAP